MISRYDYEMTNASSTSGTSSALPSGSTIVDSPSIDWDYVLGHFLEDGVEQQLAKKSKITPQHQQCVTRQVVHASAVNNPILRDDSTASNEEKEPLKNDANDKSQAEPAVTAVKTENDANPEEKPQNEPSSSAVKTVDKPKLIEPRDGKKLTAAEKVKLRSERKKFREKQRRSDVNSQFAELTALLKKIETEDAAQDDDEDGTKSFYPELTTLSSNMNRVDLIGKTIAVLSRIHNENGKKTIKIEELSEELKATKLRVDDANMKLQQQQQFQQPFGKKSSDSQVMMMVPMMVRPDGGAQPMVMPQAMSAGTLPANFSSMFNPFMVMKSPSTTQPSSSATNNSTENNQSNKPPETSNNNQQQQFVQMVPM